jgi:hypothetical protein
MTSVQPSAEPDRGLSVPFLVDPEHEDLAEHIEKRRFFWLDLQGPPTSSCKTSPTSSACIR